MTSLGNNATHLPEDALRDGAARHMLLTRHGCKCKRVMHSKHTFDGLIFQKYSNALVTKENQLKIVEYYLRAIKLENAFEKRCPALIEI